MRIQPRGALLSHRLRGEGGGAATKGGRFSIARKGGLPVFRRAKPGFKGFIILAAQPPTTTLAPKARQTLAPLEPSARRAVNPHARQGVSSSALSSYSITYISTKRTAAVQAAVLFVRFLTWRRKYPPPHHIPHPSAVRRPLRRFRPCRFWRG